MADKIIMEHTAPVTETPMILHTEPEPKPEQQPAPTPEEQPQQSQEVTVTTTVKPTEKPDKE